MAKEGSIAPKERVNIVYKPATGTVEESVELPLKMLVLGDFISRTDERRVEERDPINVDKDNFDQALKDQNIELNMSVPNKLSGDPDDEIKIKLNFKNIKDFGPEAVAAKVKPIKKLLELREALLAVKGPLSNLPNFRKKIQELVSDDDKRGKLLSELGLDDDNKKWTYPVLVDHFSKHTSSILQIY